MCIQIRKIRVFIPFQVLNFDTSKFMAMKVPIISGTSPFKYLNGKIFDVAWITMITKDLKGLT